MKKKAVKAVKSRARINAEYADGVVKDSGGFQTGSSFSFFVPWDGLCSDNRRTIFRHVLSKEYRHAMQTIASNAAKAAQAQGWKRTPYAVTLTVDIREPDQRKRDLNFSKVVKDGIGAALVVWEDDQQVRDEIWRFDDENPPAPEHAGAIITIALRVKDTYILRTPCTLPYYGDR
jgi:Holliday junction resolvase RusA-like endonuclease